MSRQIRRQIPQKQKKKRVDRNVCLLVFILIFSGILTFLLLTARDNSKLNSTLDETFDFVKNRIESYEIYNTNDQVKSLVRLLDKTTELSRVIEQEGNLSTEMLDEYAREQRLTGILVLDQNLKVIEQNAKDGDTMPLWQKLIKSDYVRDIAEHPEKTYTTRLRNKGKIYDFAAVARQDAAGILITYAQKEEVNELNGDLTMASLFSDFPFEMNGSVVICDDDKVVSTNRQELTARSIEEAKSQYKNKFEADENGIVHLRSETGNWFGRREKIKDYDAYIFFRKSGVHHTKYYMCDLCAACTASFLTLSGEQEQNRKEKYPSGPEKTSGDQCTGACICLYFSCESKNRGNRNPEIFRKYEAGSEWGYAFQSASGRTYKAGDCRAISEGILGICRYKYSGKTSGRT